MGYAVGSGAVLSVNVGIFLFYFFFEAFNKKMQQVPALVDGAIEYYFKHIPHDGSCCSFLFLLVICVADDVEYEYFAYRHSWRNYYIYR